MKNVILLTLGLIILISANSCKKKVSQIDENPYIYTHTSGLISKNTPIKVVFNDNMVLEAMVGKPVENGIINISPSTGGSATWIDQKTLGISPEESFKSNTEYNVSVNVGKIVDGVPKQYKNFSFNVQTIRQDYSVVWKGWQTPSAHDYSIQQYQGSLLTADQISNEDLEKSFVASLKSKNLNVQWVHNSDGLNHDFTILDIPRTDNPTDFTVLISGKSFDTDQEIDHHVDITPLNRFEVHNYSFSNDKNRALTFNFTDPIKLGQNLNGLIKIDQDQNQNEGENSLTFSVSGNSISIFSAEIITGKHMVTIDPSVLNTKGKSLEKPWRQEIEFPDVNPKVRFPTKGSIMAESDQLIVPFEAINLKSIDVEIVKIYANNVLQYYQTFQNNYEDYQLDNVGKIILQQKIDLKTINAAANETQWVGYGLDLNKLITAEQNAIYQIRIGFRRAYTTIPCDVHDIENKLEPFNEIFGEEVQSIYDHNWNGFGTSYDWDGREDPCNTNYYNREHFIVKSVYKSSIGIIAKGNNSGDYFIATTDINTAKPLTGVELQFYDYQQQLITKASTDRYGFATVKLKRMPYMLVGTKERDKTYLQVFDGNALSMSKFDVSGVSENKGLKAFIYGERSVWRPGDSLFLNAMILDENNKLPENHPIIVELSSPDGIVVQRKTATFETGKIIPFFFKTSPDSKTGVWSVNMAIGGASFTKLLNIETIKPNRLKVKLTVDKNELLQGKSNIAGKINSEWLIGSPAIGLKTQVDAFIRTDNDPFPEHKYFRFSLRNSSQNIEKTVYQGVLNENGSANIDLKLGDHEISDLSNVVLKTTVYESGGNFSVNYDQYRYSPNAAYVGIKFPMDQWGQPLLSKDKNEVFELLTLTGTGKPAKNIKLNIKISKVDWAWWWENNNDVAYNYAGNYISDHVKEFTVTTDHNGRANFKYQSNEWGRYLVTATIASTHQLTGGFIYVGYPDNADENNLNTIASALKISLDKNNVKVGETVNLAFEAPEHAKALITVERNNKIVSSSWHDCEKGLNQIPIETNSDMGSNAYIYVAMIQPYATCSPDLPLRMYGVIPFSINNDALHLKPLIHVNPEIQPDQNSSVSISEENGQAMAYTIAIVDEGLLDLTSFKTPDPYQAFYAKYALAVKTWDIFDLILGKYQGKMASIFAIGGDQGLDKVKGAPQANRFKPAIVHLGPFNLAKGEKKKHQFKINNYMGSVRVMVVACNGKAFGSMDKKVKIVKPLMVATTLPRRLAPGENLNVPVNIFVTKPNIKNVEIKITEQNNLVSLGSQSVQNIKFEGQGEKMVYFPIKVNNREGKAVFKVNAISNGVQASETIELDIINPNQPILKSQEFILKKGKPETLNYKMAGTQGTNHLELELSTMPPINLTKNLNYLTEYPHGCLEQTISKAFPQLFLDKLTTLSPTRKAKIKSNIEATLSKLVNFQNTNGAFSMWPNGNEMGSYVNSYAGLFMFEAQKAGYSIPQATYNQWLKNQARLAQLWDPKQYQGGMYTYDSEFLQSYRLFTLALVGKPEQSAMNLLKNQKNITNKTKWLLASAYTLIGKKSIGQSIVAGLDYSIKAYADFGYEFGSDLRDQSLALVNLTLMDQQTDAVKMARAVAASLNSGDWYSTQSVSFGIYAMAKYIEKWPVAQTIDATCTLNGKKFDIKGKESIVRITLPADQDANLVINSLSQGTIYGILSQSGKPMYDDQADYHNNLRLNLTYTDKAGNLIQPNKLQQGTEFFAIAEVSNTSQFFPKINELALAQIFPSGWEIINDRVQTSNGQFSGESGLNYQDFRDDRVYSYFNLINQSSITTKIKLMAAYKGKYYLPASSVSAMYNNDFRARIAGKWVEVN